MKPSRIIMSVLAWLGLIITMLVIIYIFKWSIGVWRAHYFHNMKLSTDGSDVTLFYSSVPIYFGIVLTSILGFLAKPRYLWLGMIITGFAHIVTYSAVYEETYYGLHYLWLVIFYVAPGFILLGLGFLLRKIAKRNA